MTNEAQPVVKAPNSIVVLTREHIGDLVCTTPALRSLRNLYPSAHIAVEVGERAACVLEGNPNVDEIITRRDHQGLRGKAEFVALMRRRRFDMGVILDDSTDMPLTLWLGGADVRAGLVRKKRFARLLTLGVAFDYSTHEMVDNFLSVVGMLGANINRRTPEIFPTVEDRNRVSALFAEAQIGPTEPIIALNPGASAPSNRWPPECFAELADLLTSTTSARLLLLGGPQDQGLSNDILSSTNSTLTVLTGKLRVLELGEVLKRCRLLITGDTGPMHLACAVGTPVLALFGPAIPSESGPLYVPGNRVIRKVDGCPKCTKYRCTQNNRCMRAIGANEVATIAREMLEER